LPISATREFLSALAPVIAGIVSLHDFRPHPMYHLLKAKKEFTFTDAWAVANYAVVPADLAQIYNLNPLFGAGISGQKGQTIALIEDTERIQRLGLEYISGRLSASPAIRPLPSRKCTHRHLPRSLEIHCGRSGGRPTMMPRLYSTPNGLVRCARRVDIDGCMRGYQHHLWRSDCHSNLINASAPPPSIMSISLRAVRNCEWSSGQRRL